MAPREKTPRRPSIKIVIFLGVVVALLGTLGAIVSLVSQPVIEVREPPAPESRKAGSVYYVRGTESGTSQWEVARQRIMEQPSGTVVISDGDLNAWARSHLVAPRASSRPGAEESAGKSGPNLFGVRIEPSGVNFRLVEDRLQMATYLEFRDLMPGRKFLYQVRGRLVVDADGLRFTAEEGTLGQAPLVQIPLLGRLVHRVIFRLFETVPEWEAVEDSLALVRAVDITEEGLLMLTFD